MRFLYLVLLLPLASCAERAPSAPAAQAGAPVHSHRIVREYPHDTAAFTQGLFWLDGHLYESTGQVGASTIRRVDLKDGRVLQSVSIPEGLFGEGIVNWGDQIVSITWRDGIGFRWDRKTLRNLGEFRYRGEGWGLTQDGSSLILSNGSSNLYFLDPTSLAAKRQITVTDAGRPVPRLNELEYVRGEIWANVWGAGRIARIDPQSGAVRSWIDLSDLATRMSGGDPDRVLNGIAYDSAKDRLFVTGKYWPKLYEIEVVPSRR